MDHNFQYPELSQMNEPIRPDLHIKFEYSISIADTARDIQGLSYRIPFLV